MGDRVNNNGWRSDGVIRENGDVGYRRIVLRRKRRSRSRHGKRIKTRRGTCRAWRKSKIKLPRKIRQIGVLDQGVAVESGQSKQTGISKIAAIHGKIQFVSSSVLRKAVWKRSNAGRANRNHSDGKRASAFCYRLRGIADGYGVGVGDLQIRCGQLYSRASGRRTSHSGGWNREKNLHLSRAGINVDIVSGNCAGQRDGGRRRNKRRIQIDAIERRSLRRDGR